MNAARRCLTWIAFAGEGRHAMSAAITYDSKSYELAEYFLSGDPDIAHLNTAENCDALAKLIQQTVEDEIASLRDNYDPTPYCSQGHKGAASCDCGPIAENE